MVFHLTSTDALVNLLEQWVVPHALHNLWQLALLPPSLLVRHSQWLPAQLDLLLELMQDRLELSNINLLSDQFIIQLLFRHLNQIPLKWLFICNKWLQFQSHHVLRRKSALIMSSSLMRRLLQHPHRLFHNLQLSESPQMSSTFSETNSELSKKLFKTSALGSTSTELQWTKRPKSSSTTWKP